MGKIIGIYKITSPIGRVYIGQSVDIERRWKRYRRYDSEKQTRLHRSLLKHGVESHIFEILETCEKEELNDKEIYYINFFNSFNNEMGLNLNGGGGNYKISDETKERMRISRIGRKLSESHKRRITEKLIGRECSESTRNKIGDSNRGRVFTDEHKEKLRNAKLGRKLSDEHIEKIKLANAGFRHSDETKLKISLAHTGKILSKEHREKLSKSHMGQRNNVGFKHSEEYKEKMRKINSIPIIQMDLNGNFIKEWNSAKEAGEYGFHSSHIGECCNGHAKTHAKFTWKFKNEK